MMAWDSGRVAHPFLSDQLSPAPAITALTCHLKLEGARGSVGKLESGLHAPRDDRASAKFQTLTSFAHHAERDGYNGFQTEPSDLSGLRFGVGVQPLGCENKLKLELQPPNPILTKQ